MGAESESENVRSFDEKRKNWEWKES